MFWYWLWQVTAALAKPDLEVLEVEPTVVGHEVLTGAMGYEYSSDYDHHRQIRPLPQLLLCIRQL